ncbi:P-II family nitrogen regulator [Halobacillus karajensis]|uniref:Nitrogen regulatory protein P-II n=1 Tax=Halobacillus karajensis TaxID=195088 RepID=A0A024P7C6_9BACI|nr:P-II family nitrogen regulator [Halobacillus karajensis]CDQ17831.1 Nitrogen regulatory protein P-II [Halobacillus karajensis]CDQ24237.1 Nitrogen regulatory protein P-II [Halobacillus karajensis]CDQ29514.1 Nitrogen regulatory protein P-II [Halobacillus karajensis]
MIKTKPGQKLIITIVKKEKAKRVIHASTLAGAQGGTTFFGKGFRMDEKKRFLGIPVEREREVILTLVSDSIYTRVMNAITKAVKLNRPRHGIGFVIDTKNVSGINHLIGLGLESIQNESKEGMPLKKQSLSYDLIVTIVNKGDAEKVVDASREAGAEGGTIITGRGTGIHEKAKLFNILIEPEKEAVLTLIVKKKCNQVLKAIEQGARLDEPGRGIAFVLNVEETVGINHILNNQMKDDMKE